MDEFRKLSSDELNQFIKVVGASEKKWPLMTNTDAPISRYAIILAYTELTK